MKMRSKMQNEKGFTLVELMVVVVILGILIAIAVPVYNNVTKTANQRAVEANLRTIDGAIMQYEAANPEKAKVGTTAVAVAGGGVLMDNDNPYLKVWPTGPDGVLYGVNASGMAIATKAAGGGEGGAAGTGPWWTATEETVTLPVSWK